MKCWKDRAKMKNVTTSQWMTKVTHHTCIWQRRQLIFLSFFSSSICYLSSLMCIEICNAGKQANEQAKKKNKINQRVILQKKTNVVIQHLSCFTCFVEFEEKKTLLLQRTFLLFLHLLSCPHVPVYVFLWISTFFLNFRELIFCCFYGTFQAKWSKKYKENEILLFFEKK
jgi:hypothetical protein